MNVTEIYTEEYLEVFEDSEVKEYIERIREYADPTIDLDELMIPLLQKVQELTLKTAFNL